MSSAANTFEIPAAPLSAEELRKMNAYWSACNYLCAGMLYLRNNPLLREPLKVFTRSVTKVTGGYAWLMGGLDALVFSGGIGEHDPLTRAEVLAGLQGMGVVVDENLNAAKGSEVRLVSASESATKIFVVPAQEDLMIAVHVDEMVRTGK